MALPESALPRRRLNERGRTYPALCAALSSAGWHRLVPQVVPHPGLMVYGG